MSVDIRDMQYGTKLWYLGHKAIYVEHQSGKQHVVKMVSGPNAGKEVIGTLEVMDYR